MANGLSDFIAEFHTRVKLGYIGSLGIETSIRYMRNPISSKNIYSNSCEDIMYITRTVMICTCLKWSLFVYPYMSDDISINFDHPDQNNAIDISNICVSVISDIYRNWLHQFQKSHDSRPNNISINIKSDWNGSDMIKRWVVMIPTSCPPTAITPISGRQYGSRPCRPMAEGNIRTCASGQDLTVQYIHIHIYSL